MLRRNYESKDKASVIRSKIGAPSLKDLRDLYPQGVF